MNKLILFIGLIVLGMTQARWICYNWSNEDRRLGAGVGNAEREKWICEREGNRRFTRGSGLCGGCWCCQWV
jgi:hypothetical protein